MENIEIKNYILGTLTVDFLIAFYLFAALGIVLSMLFHYKKKDASDKKVNKKQSFKWGYWFKDNLVRLLTSIICIFVIVRFYDELPIEYELNMFLGMLVGATLDQIIVVIRNKTSISIFQTKS